MSKPYLTYLLYLTITFIGMAAAFCIARLSKLEDLPLIFHGIILLAMAIIIWFVKHVIQERLNELNEQAIRNKNEFERGLAGMWLERFEMKDGTPGFGIIEIGYSQNSKTLFLKGNVYDERTNYFANWTSKAAYVDRNKKSILYIYDGEFSEDRLHGNGYGKLDFNTSSDHGISFGTGYFEDHSTEYHPKTFEIDRLDEEFCMKLIGQDYPTETLHKEALIKQYKEYILSESTTTELKV